VSSEQFRLPPLRILKSRSSRTGSWPDEKIVEQQLRERVHDPVPQTGQWLKSVVQGYFNYYVVPGNLASLGVFRDRVLALWWRTIRRRSQKRRISWPRILVLAQCWFPLPQALHPFPDARFAASHLR